MNTTHLTWNSALVFARRFWADDEGATLVEYVLLVALIAAVCVGAVTLLGTSANTKLNTAATALQ
jgi:pilus assembly protein Flp/PilA